MIAPDDKKAWVERSIITKFRKTIWAPFLEALRVYELVAEGDKIAVCISGGKDSMLLAKLFQELKGTAKRIFWWNTSAWTPAITRPTTKR